MNGTGKQLWAYDGVGKVWVPLAVDADGYVKVDMSAVNLDDIGNVNVPAPADDGLIYWDAAAGEWKTDTIDHYGLDNLGTKLLGHLDDVIVPAPADKDLLAWEVASAAWVKKVLSDYDLSELGTKILNNLDDVSVAAPADGQLIRWDNANSLWQKLAALTISDAGAIQALVTPLAFYTTATLLSSIGIWSHDGANFINVANAIAGGFHLLKGVLGGPLDASGELINDLADPAAAQDADTQAARDAAIATINLNDLADVNVPSPGDRFFLRYDDATSKWIAVKGYEFGMDMRLWQWELAFYDWTTTVTGSGAITYQEYGRFELTSGGVAGGTARGTGYRFGYFRYELHDFEWTASVMLSNLTTNGKIWLFIGHDEAADPTYRAIGWRVDNDALKGIVHDGTNLHVIDLGVTMARWSGYILFLKFIHGSKIEWYVNGVKKGESTDIPTVAEETICYIVMAAANGVDNDDESARLYYHGWIMEA